MLISKRLLHLVISLLRWDVTVTCCNRVHRFFISYSFDSLANAEDFNGGGYPTTNPATKRPSNLKKKGES